MILGALLPQAHVLRPAIPWLIMAMLFLVFLETNFSRTALHRSHLMLLAANILLGFVGWALGAMAGPDIALAAFFAGIAPTATAAPVVVSFLRGQVAYVVASFLLSNVAIAALMPLLLPRMLGRATPDVIAGVLGSVGRVVFAPMAAAWLARRACAGASEWPKRMRNISFGMWVTAMFVITANASEFLRHRADAPHRALIQIAAVSLLLCVVNFALGRLIGGREFPREASQALGQKNTTFTIYLALTYASPLAALGPTCYVVWHNLWNSWQLHQAARRA